MKSPSESIRQFTRRKEEHIKLAGSKQAQSSDLAQWDLLGLQHVALPELNFDEVNISTQILGLKLPTPFIISSMTAGNAKGKKLNFVLAEAACERKWIMAAGSQRRELTDPKAGREWQDIRRHFPDIHWIGNLGLAQLIESTAQRVLPLLDAIQPIAFFIHLNATQEVLQHEGTPQFRGGLKAIGDLVKLSPVPIIVKETGCGLDVASMKKLADVGVTGFDIAGLGGTHWGRIEGLRAQPRQWQHQAAMTFAHWGQSTAEILIECQRTQFNPVLLIASGGVRSGLDAARALAYGAHAVGIAQPLIEAAGQSLAALKNRMLVFENELRMALFLTGSQSISTLAQARSDLSTTAAR